MSCPRLAFCAGHQYCRPPLPSTCRSMELAPSHRPQFAARCQTSTALATFDQVALCGVCTPSKSLSAEETQNFRVSWPSKLLVFASCSHGGPWTCALLSIKRDSGKPVQSRKTVSIYCICGGHSWRPLCIRRWLAIDISWGLGALAFSSKASQLDCKCFTLMSTYILTDRVVLGLHMLQETSRGI